MAKQDKSFAFQQQYPHMCAAPRSAHIGTRAARRAALDRAARRGILGVQCARRAGASNVRAARRGTHVECAAETQMICFHLA